LIFRAEVEGWAFTVVGPGEIMCADAFTAPHWRGNAIHTLLLFRMLEWARAAGYRTAYTSVGATHQDSLASHRRLGWETRAAIIVRQGAQVPRPWAFLVGSPRHPMRGQLLPFSPDLTQRLVLHRCIDFLPGDVPWVRSLECVGCRTDCFILDPEWDLEAELLLKEIHVAVTSTLTHVRQGRSGQRVRLTILLGDDALTSALRQRGRARLVEPSMICFEENVNKVQQWQTLGVIALARASVLREAHGTNTSTSRYVALRVIEAVLSLLGHGDPRAGERTRS
jgi:hypothetical protein